MYILSFMQSYSRATKHTFTPEQYNMQAYLTVLHFYFLFVSKRILALVYE